MKKYFFVIVFLFWIDSVGQTLKTTIQDNINSSVNKGITPTNLTNTLNSISDSISALKSGKLEKVNNKNELINSSQNEIFFDGSTWKRKTIGNKRSNGVDYPGTIVHISNAAYFEREGNVITPSMFGVVGNNSTDDYQALQNMFNAVKSGDEIIFDSLTYYISKPLLLAKNNIKIRGKANIRCQGSAEITGLNGVGGGIVIQGNNCKISEITISGFATIQGSRSYEYGKLIRILGNSNLIENCLFNNGNAGGVEVTGNDNVIRDNYFNFVNNHNSGGDYGSIHLSGNTQNTQILHNNIQGQYYAAISSYGVGVKGVIIRDNYCEGANPLGLNTSAGLFFLQGSNKDIVVEYNTFKNVAAEGIGISSYNSSNTSNITIHKNIFIDCKFTGISIYKSSDNANSYNVSITDNEFFSVNDTTEHYIYLEQLNNSKITGNKIKGIQNSVGTLSYGINLAYSPVNNTINTNKIYNVNIAIQFADNKNGLVSDNTIDMCTQGIVYFYCLRSSIVNNNISDCTSALVAGASSNTTYLANNIVTYLGSVTENNPRLKVSDVTSSVQSIGDIRYAQLSNTNSFSKSITLLEASTNIYSNNPFTLTNSANASANQTIKFFVQNNVAGGGGTGQFNVRHENYNNSGGSFQLIRYDMQDINSDFYFYSPRDFWVNSNRDMNFGYKSFAKFSYNGNEIGRFSTSSFLVGTTTEVNSAAVVINSNNKGLLIPRMSTTKKNTILSPENGLLIYDTDLGKFSYWNGSTWKNILTD